MGEKKPRRRWAGSRSRPAFNITSMLASNSVTRATSFVVYAVVARTLGAESFGRLALAVSLFTMFSRFTVMGIHTVVTRSVARDPESTKRLLAQGSIAMTFGSAIGVGALGVFLAVANYGDATTRVIWIVFAGILPFSLTQLTQGVFLGWEKASNVAKSTIPVNLLQTALAVWMLIEGASVEAVAWTIVGAHTAVLAVQGFLVIRAAPPSADRVRLGGTVGLVRSALPFMGVAGVNAIANSATIIVLSQVATEFEVGIYSAAQQLLVPVRLVSEATALAVYPLMSRRFLSGLDGLRRVGSRSIEANLAFALPAVAGLVVLADQLIGLVYGDGEFRLAATVLRIVAFVGISRALTSVLGQMLWASERELISLRIALVQAALTIGASWVLASAFGVVGAAWAAVLVALANLVQHLTPVASRIGSVGILRAAWRPLLATAVMAATLIVVSDVHVAIAVPIGVAVYAVAVYSVYRVTDRNLLREAGVL